MIKIEGYTNLRVSDKNLRSSLLLCLFIRIMDLCLACGIRLHPMDLSFTFKLEVVGYSHKTDDTLVPVDMYL